MFSCLEVKYRHFVHFGNYYSDHINIEDSIICFHCVTICHNVRDIIETDFHPYAGKTLSIQFISHSILTVVLKKKFLDFLLQC